MTVRKTCVNITELLPAFAVGALTPRETQVVADHLGQCPDCTERLREWRLIVAAANVGAWESSPSPACLEQIQARIEATGNSPQRSRHSAWERMIGGQHRHSSHPTTGAGEDNAQARRPFRPSRSSVAEIAVIGLLVVVIGGGLIGRGWWAQIIGDDSMTTPQSTDQAAAQSPVDDRLVFTSVLSNMATHPGANVVLGRLTIEPGSSTGLEAEGEVILLVETGIISGLVDGPATITYGTTSERAGQTGELISGEQFQLLPGDHITVPPRTAPELQNDGQEVARAIEIRIQTPGPPVRLTNGVQYLQLARASAQLLPTGEVAFSLVETSLSSADRHEIRGPGLFYVESGTVEIAETNFDLEVKGSEDLKVGASLDDLEGDADDEVSSGGWFSLNAGDRASLTVSNGEAIYLELLFEPGNSRSTGNTAHAVPPQITSQRATPPRT